MEICYMTQGAQFSAPWQPRGVRSHGRWEGHSRGSRHMYTYGWFMLMYGRNPTQYCKAIILQLKIIKKFFTKKVTVLSKDEMALLHTSLFKSYQQFGIKFWKCHQRKKKGKPVWQDWDINNIWEANFVLAYYTLTSFTHHNYGVK